MNGLIGRKLGMTRIFNAEGTHVPVTVIEAGPCPVVAVFDGRVELGFGAKKPKNAPKALAGHVKKAGVETTPRIIRRFDVTGNVELPGGVEMVMPGDNTKMTIELITPIAMEEQLRFAIREGGRTVGAGVVTKILK